MMKSKFIGFLTITVASSFALFAQNGAYSNQGQGGSSYSPNSQQMQRQNSQYYDQGLSPMAQDQQDPTDVYAIPFDDSNFEDNQEIRELEETEQDLHRRQMQHGEKLD